MAANSENRCLEAPFETWFHRAVHIALAAALDTDDCPGLFEGQSNSSINPTQTTVKVEEAEVEAGGSLNNNFFHR